MPSAPCLSALIVAIVLAGCTRHPTMTRGQLATVQKSVAKCTVASSKLTPFLQRGVHIDAVNAAIEARNICSSARAEIVAAVSTGSRLDACYISVDRQEAVQQAELGILDRPTPDNERRVILALDEAVRQQIACGAAIAELRR